MVYVSFIRYYDQLLSLNMSILVSIVKNRIKSLKNMNYQYKNV